MTDDLPGWGDRPGPDTSMADMAFERAQDEYCRLAKEITLKTVEGQSFDLQGLVELIKGIDQILTQQSGLDKEEYTPLREAVKHIKAQYKGSW